MEPRRNYIVFQCYGNEAIFHECAFALLSLSRQMKAGPDLDVEVWIYTDKPEWFQRFTDCPLRLQFRKIAPDVLQQWRGAINFVHRVKIEVLLDFCKTHNGNLLYADTDVVFTAPLHGLFAQIAQGRLYMHTPEGRVCDGVNPVMAKLDRYLRSAARKAKNGAELSQLFMWNAGVLGFHTNCSSLLQAVLSFTDEEYSQFPSHIVEQFAFSVCFAEQGAIAAGSPWVLHYWNLKEVRSLLAEFFRQFDANSWPEKEIKAQLIQMPVLMQEKGNFYQNRSIMGKLRKVRWRPIPCYW